MVGSTRITNGARDFGGSLPVQNVQALATEDLTEIPSRYIRPEFDSDVVVSADESLNIPVIDLSKLLLHQQQEVSTRELTNFHAACRDWGFFQVGALKFSIN